MEKMYDVSKSLKQAGVAIYTVAASKEPNLAALEHIASESSNEHVFLATSLPAIIQYVHQLSEEACKGTNYFLRYFSSTLALVGRKNSISVYRNT